MGNCGFTELGMPVGNWEEVEGIVCGLS